MPLRDGTGPSGLGPGSGRGRGGCYTGSGYRNVSRMISYGRPGWLLGIAVPLVAAVVRDLMNHTGVIHRMADLTLQKRSAGNIRNNVREAECTVMDTYPVSKAQQRRRNLQ